jgi:hypothetical protein
MIPRRTLGFLVNVCSYSVLLLGSVVYGYIQRNAPRQPDPASGHVLRVTALRSRRMDKHIMYLDTSERSIYNASIVGMAAGAFGVLGQMVMTRRRNSATPSN